ncbi:GIY-YIG nuclease family protein [Clostridium sardiniense]|uniref:GIY-YIG nuclease family protein n=1 Tax=Clostridium sardiniense TaxID=29369 RepID=UPI00195BB25B|nr:GIY-YIG nuclease family protein [Clostridium sardiniense]MBM7836489.1 group I intron endonuclease [Clostridium sardiniense]
MIVYKIICKVNNKVYVGQTSESLKQRFSRHMGYQKYEHDTKFYRAVRKYGVENFEIFQIDTATNQDELDEKELFWINKLDAVNSGYNSKAVKGKCGGDTLSFHPNKTEISEKIRQSKLGDKNPMRINGGLKGERNGMYGKRGKYNKNSKKCVSVSINDPSQVLIFDSIQELQKYHKVTTDTMVCFRCNGRTKSPYKGYYFKYYEDYIKGQQTIENIAINSKKLVEYI